MLILVTLIELVILPFGVVYLTMYVLCGFQIKLLTLHPIRAYILHHVAYDENELGPFDIGSAAC